MAFAGHLLKTKGNWCMIRRTGLVRTRVCAREAGGPSEMVKTRPGTTRKCYHKTTKLNQKVCPSSNESHSGMFCNT
jgi:hypothetical protein